MLVNVPVDIDTQSRPEMITIFTHVVRPYFPTFQYDTNSCQVKIVIATGGTVSIAKWIVNDSSVLLCLLVGHSGSLSISCKLMVIFSYLDVKPQPGGMEHFTPPSDPIMNKLLDRIEAQLPKDDHVKFDSR